MSSSKVDRRKFRFWLISKLIKHGRRPPTLTPVQVSGPLYERIDRKIANQVYRSMLKLPNVLQNWIGHYQSDNNFDETCYQIIITVDDVSVVGYSLGLDRSVV